jgi:hypothetical protein
MVYKKPAKRKIADGAVQYDDFFNQTKLNRVMKKANYLSSAMNGCAVRSIWRDGKIEHDIVTFDNCEVFVSEHDPKKIVAFKWYSGLELPMGRRETTKTSGGTANWLTNGTVSDYILDKELLVSYAMYKRAFMYKLIEEENSNYLLYEEYLCDDNGNEKLDRSEIIDYRDEDGNALMPVTIITNEYNHDRIINFTAGGDIVDATIHTATDLAHLNEILKYQSHIQGVIRTSDKSKYGGKVAIGAGEFLLVETNDINNEDVTTIDLQADYDRLWNTIKSRIKAVLGANGIRVMIDDAQSSAQSGFAIMLEKSDLIELRENQIDVYREHEAEIYKRDKAVHNHYSSQKIPEGDFSIDFAEVEIYQSPQEEVALWTFLFSNKIKTPIDYIMEKNPDIDEDTARGIYEKNKRFFETGFGRLMLPDEEDEEDEAVNV